MIFQQKLVYFRFFDVKPKNFVVFAFIYVSGSSALFYRDFCINFYSVDNDEAMKWWREAIKHFIASIFKKS